MTGADVLIAGCGDVGGALACRLLAAGQRVAGMRRNIERLPQGVTGIRADLGDRAGLSRVLSSEYRYVVVASAADRFDAASYRAVYLSGLENLLDALRGQPRVLLVSSTGVYHQRDGEWVDEDSPTEPSGFSGQLLLEGEQLLRARLGDRSCVVRLGGIYGPGRERLLAEVRAGIGCAREPVRYTNRIHRDDCAGLLHFLLERWQSGVPLAPLYLGVDSEPAPMWEVRQWLARQLGVVLDDAREQTSARAVGSKRCSNRRLLEAGYRMIYPDYRCGYAALLQADAKSL